MATNQINVSFNDDILTTPTGNLLFRDSETIKVVHSDAPSESDFLSVQFKQAFPSSSIVSVNGGESLVGKNVNFVGSDSISIRCIEEGESFKIYFDTIYSPSAIHEHRTFQQCVDYADGIAYIPNKSDIPIPGTVEFYMNGVGISPLLFNEHIDQYGKVDGVSISYYNIDFSKDIFTFNYQIKPNMRDDIICFKNNRPNFQNIMIYNVKSSDFYYPVQGDTDKICYVPLPDSFDQNSAILFAENSSGYMIACTYEYEWDTEVFIGTSNKMMRWRYVASKIGAAYDKLSIDNDKFAKFPLEPSSRVMLLY